MGLPIRLDAREDPRVADYRDVADAHLVREKGLFVAEGRLVVHRLLEDGRCRVRSLLLNEAAFVALQPVLANLDDNVPIYVSSPQALSTLVGFDVHRGCLALAERPEVSSLTALLDRVRMLAVLEGVADPSNLGAIFRNAFAFGVDAVLLSPTCCDPLYRKAVRTSMAATIRVPFARARRWPGDLSMVKERCTLVALTPQEPAVALEALASSPRPARLALLIGTEGAGLTPDVASMADVRLRVPVEPRADSLNVAVAAGIVFYRLGYAVY
ncbi:MAG: TrmH family RNA methyltransferase [Vicinamibacterales bacterium]